VSASHGPLSPEYARTLPWHSARSPYASVPCATARELRRRFQCRTVCPSNRGLKSKTYRRAKEQVMRSGNYAFRDRKVRKRDFRKLWIIRINAGARQHGMSYSQLMHGLKLAEIDVDRKILADLAVAEPKAFGALVEQAKKAIEKAAKSAAKSEQGEKREKREKAEPAAADA